MKFSIALSGIALGAGFGFVLQRGRFCLNTAFRNILYIKDYTLFRSYVLALVIGVIGAHLLRQLDLLHIDEGAYTFPWLANILGGYLFGVGMVLAGGGAAGVWYRAGEGLVGSWMAALGLALGAAAAAHGALAGVSRSLRSIVLFPGSSPAAYGLIGINKWILVVLLSGLGLAFVFAGRRQRHIAQPGYRWQTAGALVGALIVLGLYVSELATGAASGFTFPGPSGNLMLSVAAGAQGEWGVFMLMGVPLGSFISARGLHEFSWRAPRADVMVQQLFGGVIMGVGGVIAGGCSIGHGLTGLSLLAPPSVASMTFIILGCWSMVYVVFMRGSSGA